jgi:hypothetical protein
MFLQKAALRNVFYRGVSTPPPPETTVSTRENVSVSRTQQLYYIGRGCGVGLTDGFSVRDDWPDLSSEFGLVQPRTHYIL